MATLTSKTVEDALLQTLRVRGRLHEPKLIFFTQLRYERDTKSNRPTVVAVKKALTKLVTTKKIAKLEANRYELGTKAPPVSAKPKKKPQRERLPPGRCFFPV